MIVLTWAQLLFAILTVVSFYLVELLYFFYKQKKNKEAYSAVQHLEELDAVKKELELVKIRLSALAATFASNSKPTLDILPSQPISDLNESPYTLAINLVNQGANAEEVAIQCGISRGEADLIVAIYRSAARS